MYPMILDSPIVLVSLIVLAALVAIGAIYAALYQKAQRGIALVRTGMGGRKVMIDGGCLRLPVFHDLRKVNLSTVQLTVRRHGEDALITKDSLRVDVTADFYVSVQENHDSVAEAARTLGDRTFDADQLRDLIEGKLVDALRAVAATQDMMSLHENRQDFVQKVQDIVLSDLNKNGLQLEAVSLTGLDQTPIDNLNPNNMFNATALKVTAERVSEQTQARAEAEANARIAEANEHARAEEESVRAAQRVEQSRIDQEREVAVYRAESEAKSRQAAIASDRAAEQAEVEKDEALRARGIERDRKLKLAEQEQEIEIATKSKEQSQAHAEAEEARQAAVVAEEGVRTARERAAAERAKGIAVVKAEEEAEVDATRLRVAAQARQDAAEHDAAATRTGAEAAKDAAELDAQAEKARKEAEAEGIKAVNDAKNQLSERVIRYEERIKELEISPVALRELVKPFEGVGAQMKSVFIHGLNGNGAGGNAGESGNKGAGSGGSQSVVEDLFDQMMRFVVSQPALKQLGESVGFDLRETLATGRIPSRASADEDDETAPGDDAVAPIGHDPDAGSYAARGNGADDAHSADLN